MANEDVERLRAQVRKRRSAVTSKIWRIRKNTGVDISGHSDDPRRPANAIKRYNKPQLNAYLRELNNFMSRDVGYVAGADNTPISKKLWNRYKRLERRYNRIGDEHFDRIADMFIPAAGITIRQRENLMRPDIKHAGLEDHTRPYAPVDRKARHIQSPKALEKLIKTLEEKTKSGYNEKRIADAKIQAKKMLTLAGMSGEAKEIDKLSTNQMDILWNYTNFASSISLWYHTKILKNQRGNDQRWYDSVMEDSENEFREFLGWGRTLPK